MSGLRTIYLGTSEFAATVLRRLADSPHRPALVVTPPDRRKGRGRKMAPPPAAEVATELGLDLLQTANVNQPEPVERIRAIDPQVGCVCAFGQLIKDPLLDQPPMLNVHPSLLPRWRGAAPIERSMMEGDRTTGVTIMRLTAGLDSGPIALQTEVGIDPGEDFGSLAGRLAQIGGDLLVEALDLQAAGELELREQPEEGVTYAEKIEVGDRRLDPEQLAERLAATTAALTPHIGAYLALEGDERLGVTRAAAIGSVLEGDPEPGPEPGAIAAGKSALIVRCGGGSLLAVERLKPPGKREMDAADYLRGHAVADRVLSGGDG